MWKQHKYTNKLGFYWEQQELTSQEQSKLHWKMILNYYGFWLSKLAHLSVYYWLYKRNFFRIASEFTFWSQIGIISTVLLVSDLKLNKVINQSLAFEIEDLQAKYSSQIDVYRKEYLSDKRNKQSLKMMKLEELQENGNNVRDLIQGYK